MIAAVKKQTHLIQINVNGRQDTFQGAARHAYTYPSQPEGLPVNRSKYRRNDAITQSVVNTYLKLVDLYVVLAQQIFRFVQSKSGSRQCSRLMHV